MKIKKIEMLSERSDCGCLEVEGNHNFAVSMHGNPCVFIKNSVLENYFVPQCLSLSTKIDLMDGRTLSLSQIISEYNEGKKNYVYSIDQKYKKILCGEIEWAGITRKNANLVRVYLDNDTHVDCTPDHKFVTLDGSEVMAEKLAEGISLMPLYQKTENINKNSNDYQTFYDPQNIVINYKVVKVEYLDIREDTGCLTVKDSENNHNFALSVGIFVKNSSEGRGSDITSVGGNAAGFTQLDDIYYFSHKLYRALKYPLSRITQGVEGGQDVMFGGSNSGQISRDEIKWAKYLEKIQRKFCNELVDLFLLHLEFRGFRKQYNLNMNSFTLRLNPPSHYKEQMNQGFLEQSFQNYNALCQNAEFSKSYLVKKYLHWTEEELGQNRDGFRLDKKYFPPDEVINSVDSYGGAGIVPGTYSMQQDTTGAEQTGGVPGQQSQFGSDEFDEE